MVFPQRKAHRYRPLERANTENPDSSRASIIMGVDNGYRLSKVPSEGKRVPRYVYRVGIGVERRGYTQTLGEHVYRRVSIYLATYLLLHAYASHARMCAHAQVSAQDKRARARVRDGT